MSEALHIQVGRAGVARYRADAALVAALGAAEQIRATLDTSGSPAGVSALIVRARDLGGYQGMSSRKLVEVELRVTIRTHLDEDQDREVHDALASQVLAIAGSRWTPPLTGWIVRHVSSAECTDVEADPAGVFRDTDVTQRLLAQAVVDSGVPVDPQDPAAPSSEVTDPLPGDRLSLWHGDGLDRGYVTWETLTTELKGEQGDQGPQGIQGPRGERGAAGAPYGDIDGGNATSVYAGVVGVDGGGAA